MHLLPPRTRIRLVPRVVGQNRPARFPARLLQLHFLLDFASEEVSIVQLDAFLVYLVHVNCLH